LPAGAALTVFFEESEYVFAEFNASAGLMRGWLEAKYVISDKETSQ
jgi:hypothetical protein